MRDLECCLDESRCKLIIPFFQSLRIPINLQDAVDLGCLTIRSKPFEDKDVSFAIMCCTSRTVCRPVTCM